MLDVRSRNTDADSENILWHLQENGITRHHPEQNRHRSICGLNALKAHNDGHLGKGVTVAIIDSGADREHHNLTDAISAKSASFEAYHDGQGQTATDKKIFNRFDAHGSALAGIVAGRPNHRVSAADLDKLTPQDQALVKTYTGVAPAAEVLVIRLFVNFQPEQFESALNYAAKHADVLLLARTLPQVRKKRATAALADDPDARASTDTLDDSSSFSRIESLLTNIAKEMPVVCAAGNGGFDELSFPASLSMTIAVGAVNELGWRSTYSQYGSGLDVVAPSSDAELLNRDQNRVRLSRKTAKERRFTGDPNSERLGYWGIVSTDNHGEWGYVGLVGEPGNFTPQKGELRFGGTSAAAAQVAGVVALMIGANPALRNRPAKIREILRKTATFKELDDALTRDNQNRRDASTQPSAEFGWGLVDATDAVKEAARSTD